MPAPPLLSITPDLQAICMKVFSHKNARDSLQDCLNNAVADYFDATFVGYNNSQKKFGKYGEPSAGLSTTSLSWNWDSLTMQSFTVSCNKTRWYIAAISNFELFSVTVWDIYGTEVTDQGYFETGATVKVTPISTNSGSANKYFYIHIGTLTGTAIAGALITGVQKFSGAGIPPYVYFSSGDATFTVYAASYTLPTGSTNLWIYYTPQSFAGSNYPIYWYVYRGSILRGSATQTGNYNDNSKSLTITLNEGAIAGATYNVIGLTTLG